MIKKNKCSICEKEIDNCRDCPKLTVDTPVWGYEDVLEIVDALFHEFASSYRTEARERAMEIMEGCK